MLDQKGVRKYRYVVQSLSNKVPKSIYVGLPKNFVCGSTSSSQSPLHDSEILGDGKIKVPIFLGPRHHREYGGQFHSLGRLRHECLILVTNGERLFGSTACLPHKNVGISLSALPKDTTRKLAGLFSTPPFRVERQRRSLTSFGITMNPRSTDSEADAPTTAPLRRFLWLHC